jgi:CxxC motif-containing protein
MKQLTCITCPIGCRVTVDTVDGKYAFAGNQCKRGAEFAEAEISSPMRSLTTTVRTAFPDAPVLSVRTRGEVPKGKLTEIIRELSRITVTEIIGIGEVVAANAAGTGCDIIATSDILRGKL